MSQHLGIHNALTRQAPQYQAQQYQAAPTPAPAPAVPSGGGGAIPVAVAVPVNANNGPARSSWTFQFFGGELPANVNL